MPEQTENNTENTKKIDTGLSIIIGLKVPLSENLFLDLDIRDYLGLINLSKIDIIDNGSIKTNSLGLQIGLKYKL